MEQIILTDNKIELRPLQLEDAELLYPLVEKGRDYLRKWLDWVDKTTSPEEIRSFIQSVNAEGSKEMHFGIRVNNTIVGVIGFHHIDRQNKHTSIGYWLAKDAQGKGIMTSSCELLVNYGFTNLGLNRIELRAAVENEKSNAIAKRLGFTHEGIAREWEMVNGKFLDINVYSLLVSEWK